jgi:3-oxoacyl-[acyl-carrier protein] reductase
VNLGLRDRRCVVVGGGRGLGAEIACQLAAEGADIVLVARTVTELEQTCDRVRETGRAARAIAGDIAAEAEAVRVMTAAVAAFGGVDVLVNSATAAAHGGFDDLTDEQWLTGLAVKPLGFARAVRGVLPTMRAAGHGRIVNICGSGGRFARTDYALGALNAATLHLTKVLAEAEARNGISVIAINPGPIHTPRLDEFITAEAAAAGVPVDDYRAAYLARLPLGRLPSAQEVAKVVVMFCSDLTEYCTGSAVQIDGATLPGIF